MRILLWLLSCLIPIAVQAQSLRFNASTPDIDSFPVVRFTVTVAENGSIPSPALTPSNFTVTDGGQAVSTQLVDCDDSRKVAVVVAIDHSGSMVASAGDGFNQIWPSFRDSFEDLFANLKPQSKYAVLPFTFTADVLYPQPPAPPFYDALDAGHLASAMSVVNGLIFSGSTNVDNAIFKAAAALEYQPFETKAIVLVTDDFIHYPDSVLEHLQKLGIMLCVFQAGSDFTKYSFDIANATGGIYFQVADTSTYDEIMLEMAEHLSAEHCILQYTSPHPCPWYKSHPVSLTLARGTQTRNLLRSYTLGYNVNDTTPPPITEIAPTYITRRISATGDFPCERGLKEFRDSVRQNIGVFQRTRSFPSLASDSLRVQDSMQSAHAIYVALDSGNNRSTIEIFYTPQPDTLDPQIVLTSSTGGNYRASITETRAWDRGLFSAAMAPGAVNLVFDSVKWYSKSTGQIWFHQPDPLAVSTGCIEVQDSVGNVAHYCIDRGGPASDTLPPIIVKNPQLQPRTVVTAAITELRLNDRGIKQIATAGLANFANQQIVWTNGRQATLTLTIVDSLTAARAYISASDSADNLAEDSLRYDPLPDVIPPICVVETVDVATRKFRTTDRAAWDRGILDVTIVGTATNLAASAVVFIDRFEAEQTFTLIDKTLPGSVVLRSRDSVGHDCLTTIDIGPSETPPTPLLPLETASSLDFGKVFAPGDETLLLSIRNPNDKSVVITQLLLTGDPEVTVPNTTTPFFFAPLETKLLDIRYQPTLLNMHAARLVLANDTMTLSQTEITGQGIGRVRLNLDSITVSAPEVPGVLHLSIDATPNPINLDVIRFTLVYNRDVAVLDPQLPDCGGGNPLCDYAVTYTGDPESGRIEVELMRTDRSRNQALVSATAKIDIPFITFLAKDTGTTVSVENAFASQESVIASDTGFIDVGSDLCGTELLRAYLQSNSISITGISPNPAAESVSITGYSAIEAEGTLAIYDATGNCIKTIVTSLAKGTNAIALTTSDMSSGYYVITLTTANGFTTARLLVEH